MTAPLCLENFENYPMLGQFTLCDQGVSSDKRLLTASYYCCDREDR